jgi:GAF domain-containing protein
MTAARPVYRVLSDLTPDNPLRQLMDAVGITASISIPILVDGTWAGQIIASVTDASDRLRPTTGDEEKLLGLGSRTATAIRNSRLLELPPLCWTPRVGGVHVINGSAVRGETASVDG